MFLKVLESKASKEKMVFDCTLFKLSMFSALEPLCLVTLSFKGEGDGGSKVLV